MHGRAGCGTLPRLAGNLNTAIFAHAFQGKTGVAHIGKHDQQVIEVRDSLEFIDASQWNALSDSGNPFVLYEFLYSLECTACMGEHNGWYPRYFFLWSSEDDSNRELLAAVPAYIKTNSYGEFVFDWAWAEAYERNGLSYYPKLISSIPFTPATGPRLLIRADQPFAHTGRLLAAALMQFAASQEFSGVHFLFMTKAENDLLCGLDTLDSDAKLTAADKRAAKPQSEANSESNLDEPSGEPKLGFMRRVDCQYHWHNDNYDSFDAFLSACTSKRRKTIRRERRHVSDANLTLVRRLGNTLSAQEWEQVHTLYASTYDRKWGNPNLSLEFFIRAGKEMGANILIVFAYEGNPDQISSLAVACSIMFVGESTLYGRFWGCNKHYNSLHFEACYYQGIEYCIEHNIANFEPGAQGEHKITRGFEPTITQSAHFIAQADFRGAIQDFLKEETGHIEDRCAGLANLLPFKAELN